MHDSSSAYPNTFLKTLFNSDSQQSNHEQLTFHPDSNNLPHNGHPLEFVILVLR